VVHQEVPSSGLTSQDEYDQRWIRVRRPTIVVGGELTMQNLEITLNASVGILEAPLQMKSNCGTLVIDDFGRQRMRPEELLNRWIVPLEKRHDYLNFPSGKKVQVPFDQVIVFSTNLDPKDIVDEAFLRRIPYKIEAVDPTESQFRAVLKVTAKKLDIAYRESAVDYLIETYYKRAGRAFRFCHPRDLLQQVKNLCEYHDLPRDMINEYFDVAISNYFATVSFGSPTSRSA
jgi:predicted ATPase with chaperone activity